MRSGKKLLKRGAQGEALFKRLFSGGCKPPLLEAFGGTGVPDLALAPESGLTICPVSAYSFESEWDSFSPASAP